MTDQRNTQGGVALPLKSLERLGDQMPGGFFAYRADEKQELLYVNDSLRAMFGCENAEQFQELTGNVFSGLVYPEDLKPVLKSIEEQIAGNENRLDYVEYRIRRRDGEIRWVDDYGRLFHTLDYGDVFFVMLRDITEVHTVRVENSRKAEVIEGLSVDFSSIYLLNLTTGTMRPYRLNNSYFNEIVGGRGLKRDADGQADWRQVLPLYGEKYVLPEDRERFLNETSESRIRERLTNEKRYSVNYRCAGGDREITYMEMSFVLIDGEGSEHAVMGFRDVTGQTLRVQREMAERLKTEMDLEREKRANEIKSAFLFNISHDIRTPMNAIMGFSTLARRHLTEPDRLEDYLTKVDESSRQLMALIDDLLEMSRLNYGRIELRAEPCDLREQLEKVLDLFRGQAEEKRLTIEEQVELEDGMILVDDNRFRRIMSNLLSNAVKFTPSGGSIQVRARRKQVSDSGFARFEFSVSDTGVGMTEDFMRRMYEAFEREESSTKSGSVGTGLGLSITKSLLDIMGGSISVKSKKGVGSTFTVDLPLRLADHAPQSGEEQQEKTDYRAAGEHRILLVEDIEINRMLAETILEEAGFLVESVPDGCDAVEAIRGRPLWYYDLVLMDIQMPVMNGYEATRSIRALNRADARTMPIIALSANAREEDRRMSLESGMNHHIAKPFDVAQLISTVNEHIAAREEKD